MENVIDYVKLSKCLDNIKLYNNEFNSSYEKLLHNLNDMGLYYKTNNIVKINNILSDINDKFLVINYNNLNSQKYIDNKVFEYRDTQITVNKIIDNMLK